MNINATLFVQAINFCIAYFLLRNFLFKPVYGAILQDEATKDALKNVIAKQELRIQSIEDDIDQDLKTNQAFFKTHIPKQEKLEPGINRGIVPEVPFQEPTTQEIKAVEKQAEQTITNIIGKSHE